MHEAAIACLMPIAYRQRWAPVRYSVINQVLFIKNYVAETYIIFRQNGQKMSLKRPKLHGCFGKKCHRNRSLAKRPVSPQYSRILSSTATHFMVYSGDYRPCGVLVLDTN